MSGSRPSRTSGRAAGRDAGRDAARPAASVAARPAASVAARGAAGVRALQAAVAVLGLVPVSAGLSGVLLGPGMAGLAHAASTPSLDSHVRYLSGLLLGIGLGFWGTIPGIARRGAAFRLLTAIVVAGGLGRLLGVLLDGPPPAPMLFGLLMELVVTPALCVWQMRIARAPAALGGGAPRA